MKHLITTIIPTYRRPALLKKAIQSVLSQTYPNFQLWICDNASGDETAWVTNEFAQKDPRVKYFCHAKNIGMVGNYQYGLSLVSTTYFSFLSDDDLLLPNFYETALEGFRKYPDAGFVAGSTIITDSNGKIIRVPLDEWRKEGKYTPVEGFTEMIGKYPVPTSVMYSKKVLDHVSIDTDNTLLWDPDYLLQIASLYPIVISKKPCGIFISHPFSFSKDQNLVVHENAIKAIILRIQNNKNLSSTIIKEAVFLKHHYLFMCRRAFFFKSIDKKDYLQARQIAQLFYTHPRSTSHAIFYLAITSICKLLPWTVYVLRLIKKAKHLIRELKATRYDNYVGDI